MFADWCLWVVVSIYQLQVYSSPEELYAKGKHLNDVLWINVTPQQLTNPNPATYIIKINLRKHKHLKDKY